MNESVLAIVPAHDEAGRIGGVVRALVEQGLPVLVVDARDYRDMPPIRRFTNSVSRALLSWAMGERIADNQSGYRLHSRRLAEAALAGQEQGFAFEVEEIALCLGRGYELAWVPIKTIYGSEKSDIRPWAHFAGFVRVTWRARRLMKREGKARL